MHKKKGSESVLAGELILTFFKTGMFVKYDFGQKLDLEATVAELLKHLSGPLYGERLFNDLILRAWNLGAIDSLNVSKHDFSALLESLGWEYDATKHHWWKKGARSDCLALEAEPELL